MRRVASEKQRCPRPLFPQVVVDELRIQQNQLEIVPGQRAHARFDMHGLEIGHGMHGLAEDLEGRQGLIAVGLGVPNPKRCREKDKRGATRALREHILVTVKKLVDSLSALGAFTKP